MRPVSTRPRSVLRACLSYTGHCSINSLVVASFEEKDWCTEQRAVLDVQQLSDTSPGRCQTWRKTVYHPACLDTPFLLITSCTGEKAVKHPEQLTYEDFKSPMRRALKERLLASLATRAGNLYTGDHHRYLMEGVRLLRKSWGLEAVQLRIISAGYGLVEENQELLPYDFTFDDIPAAEAKLWAKH